MPRTAYNPAALLSQNFKSDNCVHVRPSLCIAASHLVLPLGLSKETPTIVKFLPLYLLYALTTFGFSCLQGPHQDAQKSTKTYLPLNDDRLIILPLVSASANSGAIAPNATRFNLVSL